MQLQPDYSVQLQQIAKALNRPSTPAWLVSLISAVVGALFAVVVQLFLKWADNRREITSARRALYHDVVRLFYAVDTIRNSDHIPDLIARVGWQRDQLAIHVTFDTAKQLRAKPEIYYQLSERSS